MTAPEQVTLPLLVLDDRASRVGRDRLELLIALVNAPNVDPLYRSDIITIPPRHAAYGWACGVDGCERTFIVGSYLCGAHAEQWKTAKAAGTSRAAFLRTADPMPACRGFDLGSCRICPDRPMESRTLGLCRSHTLKWAKDQRRAHGLGFEQWLSVQTPRPGYGTCQVAVCSYLANSPLGLCEIHEERYKRDGRPGGADNPRQLRDTPQPVVYDDRAEFVRWCAVEGPCRRTGVINLVGLAPLLRAEIQWVLHIHAQRKNRAYWDPATVQRIVNLCRRHRLTSLFDLDSCGTDDPLGKRTSAIVRAIHVEAVRSLRCVYYSPSDTKDAGYIDTVHFGRHFKATDSQLDLTGVSQRWLRDLLWDHLAEVFQSLRCPRTRGPLDNVRRACVELSAFAEIRFPQGGHDPTLLRAEHAQQFVADQRHREHHGLPSVGMTRSDGKRSTVTSITRRAVFNHIRKLFYLVMETGEADRIGLDRAFVTAFPPGGADRKRSRNPFSDEVARALADEANLARFSETYDLNNRGLRDVWETIVYTGRRCSEVLELRLDCIGRYRGLPMLWHDQTKVGNYNEGIRIPEYLFQRLDQRRHTTLTRFDDRHGRPPSTQEQAALALFPTVVRNPDMTKSICYGHFNRQFRTWVASLNLGAAVAHQARHTLATNLLRAGASLAHIRKYLGHVSDRMAEHYTKIAHSDLEDVLHAVWVAGPGASNPGELLSGQTVTPLSREEALALALDLSRRSTPADGGFCTFQPVVQGGTCPWKLDCENCDKFVLSGADLLYWRRKQEQWRSIAERAPDDTTADYLHQVFEPTARAITGLEKALAGLGLLEQALAMDLRRPQDYFHRIWSTNFRASDLAALDQHAAHPEPPAEHP